jgi:cell division protein ZapA
MVNVNVKFNGRDYLLACEDGQEQELEKLAVKLNDKFNKLKKDLGNLGEAKLLLITAFQIIDDVQTLRTNLDKLKEQNLKLENKFKEIKNLSISYKEDRDKETETLKQELENLKNTLDENQNNYSEILSKVSNSINNFISKAI